MKVLIAVDGSATAEEAFNWYLERIHRDGNELCIVHRRENPKLPILNLGEGTAFPSDEITKIMSEANSKASTLENKFSMKCAEKKIKHKMLFETSGGSPGEAIVAISEKEGCDMIIMGSRGLGAIRRTILGSVSDYVIHHSSMPVAILPKN